MQTVTFISNSPEETFQLGCDLGRRACRGHVFGLFGDMGAGKTVFVKGLAIGLEITETVSSPTYGLVSNYAGGRLNLFHLDLYRLDTPEQIYAAGLEEYLQPQGVSAIEWMERWVDLEEGRVIKVYFEDRSETERMIRYDGFSH